jgi:hypothetical protein
LHSRRRSRDLKQYRQGAALASNVVIDLVV